jgi:pimeloyl-ACP methyl ester carboxylesterase
MEATGTARGRQATAGERRRRRGERRLVRMVPATMRVGRRRVRYAVSSNVDDDQAASTSTADGQPIWAINIHGYFAGGGMYWRESAHLAERFGWRVINPCLPGFAGSDPFEQAHVGIEDFAAAVLEVLDHVGAGPAVVLGHSMGGAVAMSVADLAPERVLGIVYRAGVATPAWRDRRGLIVGLVSAVAPELAALVDLGVAVALDFPDLLIGRHPGSTMRMTFPDATRNLRVTGRLVPIAAMLFRIDQRDQVARVAQAGIPVLPEWGCFDRIVTPPTAAEFAGISGHDVVWVPGGHSWMLPRPQAQADILTHLAAGQTFITDVARRQLLLAHDAGGTATATRSGRHAG